MKTFKAIRREKNEVVSGILVISSNDKHNIVSLSRGYIDDFGNFVVPSCDVFDVIPSSVHSIEKEQTSEK